MATGWHKKQHLWKTNTTISSRNLVEFCMNVLLATFFFLDFFLLNTVEGISADHENRILKEVISKYSNSVRPSVREDETVNFTLDITFNNIIDVDEKNQILTTSIWVRQFWTNPLTSWNESQYGGLKELIIDSNKVWQPDTVLYNNVYAEYSGRLDAIKTRVRLSHNGFTYWAAPFIFKTLCRINVADFPFDTQICKLTFGCWQYNGNEVNIRNTKKIAAIASTRVENGEWEVLKVLIERKEVFYKCCPNQPYPEISFIIHMKRRPLFYVVNLVIPNILISLLAFFSFFIPVECGERISFVITVLLSMTVFMLLVAESIPPTSDAVPVIGIYYTFSIFEVFLALLATGVSLKINYSYMFGDGLSPKLRRILFKVIGPCFGFDVAHLLDQGKKATKASFSRIDCCGKSHPSNGDEELDRVMYSEPLCDTRSRKSNNNGSIINKFKFLEKNDNKSHVSSTNSEDVGELLALSPSTKRCYHQHHLHNCAFDDVVDGSGNQRTNQEQKMAESKLAASIIDHLFLWIFVGTYVISSVLILIIPLMNLYKHA
ncbi:neuronal acetylcholine receptor subunit alpha-10-like [Actinia tenebrosa]|uniref:Neuronal acetylcholine receptor subunit alpha-10-like n=1 Tax=Actinia tenebrosa TaxID=6105 RepID=A0A6P8ICH6_ACTTE|nr:neuronal acetylcholine receptor subunit alpha-10-like [Actinia tenebrosa]XP_031563427.1 neuronal acetylcholine receptor subunit alpha-10-like [Actinia tenebrosa]